MLWDGWSLHRIVVLFVGIAYLMLGIQVTLFHYRQNFHHKSMWTPVLLSPLLFITGVSFSIYGANWLSNVFSVLLSLGVIVGLIGFYFHFRGVGVRVGGWELRNFLIGPPVILPLMFSALSALGLLAVFW
jgi:CHASE2 domain-containing sensor protein